MCILTLARCACAVSGLSVIVSALAILPERPLSALNVGLAGSLLVGIAIRGGLD